MADNNKYSLGVNNTLRITDDNGNVAISESLLNFASKPDDEFTHVNHMNGRRGTIQYKNGWSGSFEIARQGADFDNYWANQESRYYNGLFSANTSIMQTVKEPDGSITQWQFINVTLMYDDAGTWEHGHEVRQRVSFFAERRLPRS